MKTICTQCGKAVDENSTRTVDGKVICTECMYSGAAPVQIYPIGIVCNTQKRANRGFGVAKKAAVSTIRLLESQRPFMYRLEEEPYLTVVYYLHKSGAVRSVFRRGLDGKKTGLFATRTPDRLSRLAIQDVRLVKIEGTTLYVEGLDAIDGSPVLDIKLCWHNPELVK
ncbi:MAG: SAM-dependent methyltransferase [Spirochaetes bacterium]|nr:SAM-dependent methyltransferase [Spirochaetota bacterium]